MSDSGADLRILSPEAFARLEAENPGAALRVQRLVVDRLASRLADSVASDRVVPPNETRAISQ
jgi:hypothetical protein